MPEGKFQRSPTPTSSTKLRPSWSTALMRATPSSMMAHSASLCQWSSRMPPGFRRMLTPAIDFETGQFSDRHLPRPAARLEPHVSHSERKFQVRDSATVRNWGHENVGIQPIQCHVSWTRISSTEVILSSYRFRYGDGLFLYQLGSRQVFR